MKNILACFLLLSLLLSTACKDDSRDLEVALRYDGDNFNAPLLEADLYEAAARFPASVTGNYTGRNLTEVEYYMAGTPQQTILRVYGPGTDDEPGTILYESALSGDISQNSFNTHVLDTPVAITGEELWISIRFRNNRTLQTIGCDPGPRVPNGDFLYQESDGRWLSFAQRTGESINWNIRGVVTE